MIDDEGQRQFADHVRQRDDVGRVEMQHDVPAHLLDAVGGAVEQVHVRRAAEVLDEIEARGPHAAVVQRLVFGVAEGFVDDADALDVRRVVGDGVEHGAVVAPWQLACTITVRATPRWRCSAASISLGASSGV